MRQTVQVYIRRAVLFLGVFCVLWWCGATRADALVGLPSLRFKIGLFSPQNSSLRGISGSDWLKIGADFNLPLGLLGFGTKTRVGIDYAFRGSSNILPITFNQIFQPSAAVASSPVYVGAGVGLWTIRAKGQPTLSRIGFRLLAGLEYSGYLLEFQYDFVDRAGAVRADGLSVLVGLKF